MIKEEGNLGVTTYKCVIQKQLINFLINNLFCRHWVAMATAFPGDGVVALCLCSFSLINSFHSIVVTLRPFWLCEGGSVVVREIGPGLQTTF